MDQVQQRELCELALTIAWKLTFHTYERNPIVGDEIRRDGRARAFKEKACEIAMQYARGRGEDNALSYEPESSFFPDIARLIVPIVKPRQLYADGCKKVALSVSRCLLQSRGFEPKSVAHKEDFEAIVLGMKVYPESSTKALHSKIARIIERDWHFTGNIRVDAFKSVVAFRELNGHDLTVFARYS